MSVDDEPVGATNLRLVAKVTRVCWCWLTVTPCRLSNICRKYLGGHICMRLSRIYPTGFSILGKSRTCLVKLFLSGKGCCYQEARWLWPGMRHVSNGLLW